MQKKNVLPKKQGTNCADERTATASPKLQNENDEKKEIINEQEFLVQQ